MCCLHHLVGFIVTASVLSLLTSCASTQPPDESGTGYYRSANYADRLPQQIETHNKKVVLVDPNVHAWGAYDTDGHLVRAGIATAGGTVCPPDAEGETDCRTGSGTFHITSIGGDHCYSKKYPRPNGGGLMPNCMFFNGGQALHGSPDDIVIESNVSHGCVRMRIPDAYWMVNNFAHVGTKVIVVPYS